MSAKIIDFQSTLLEVDKLSPTVSQFTFSVPLEFTFQPGQFVTMVFTIRGKQVRRSYSIASLPSLKGRIELCIKHVEGGTASPLLFSMKVGESIRTLGPLGLFVVQDPMKDAVFVSAGTGIGPYRSMIPSILENRGHAHISLIAGFKHEEEAIYQKEFEQLARSYDDFEYHPTLSKPKDQGFQGNVGRVQQLVDKQIPKGFKGDVYLCGMYDMVKEVTDQLLKKGINKEQIFAERYD